MSKHQLFQQFLETNDTQFIIDILDQERRSVFDYLIRMTGNYSRALDSTNETIDSIFYNIKTYSNYDLMKTAIYKTARNFNSDLWNANTDILERIQEEEHTEFTPKKFVYSDYVSSSHEELKEAPEPSTLLPKRPSLIPSPAENILRRLKGEYREFLILKYRCHFPPTAIKEIMKLTEKNYENLVTESEGAYLRNFDPSQDISQHLVEIPYFDLPPSSNSTTSPLSQLISNVKSSQTSSKIIRWLTLCLLVIGLLVISAYLFYFFYELII